MDSSSRRRTVLSLVFACGLMLPSAAPLRAQEDTDQPTAPTPEQVQQLIDQATQQAQPGQVPTAPGSPLPQEPTIAQLREQLDRALHAERQRELLGQDSDPQIAQLQRDLLDRTYTEDIQPVLQNATSNCLIAELGFGRAAEWARQVEVLGLGNSPEDTQDVGATTQGADPGEYGPLYGELATTQSLLVQILQNCDRDVYEACVRDDGDPNAPFLGAFARQLAYIDDNPVYEQRYRNCEIGWHGTFTIHEEMGGASRSRQAYPNGSAMTIQWETTGTRDFSLERPNKKAGTTGTAKGHSLTTEKFITSDPRCTSTQTLTREVTGEGSGDASLRKLAPGTDGSYVLGFTGPDEPGAAERSTSGTQSTCGRADPPQTQSALGRTAPYRGTITDKVADPLAERISGSRNMQFVINGAGALTLAQETTGGALVRIPATPGGSPVRSEITPWLTTTPPSNVDQSNYPTVRVTVTWNLIFGGE
jgi:hypothetical protein